MSDFLDDFEVKFTYHSKRRAFRVKAEDLKIKIDNKIYTVRDLSSVGLSFWLPSGQNITLQENQIISFTLFTENKDILEGEVRIVRKKTDYIACEFLNLTKKQEMLLDKLVLEEQKTRISEIKQKAKESEENNENT